MVPALETGGTVLGTSRLIGERNGLRLWGPLDLHIRAGEAIHLRGPNGCGKTTLLRTLAGLRPPLAGHIARTSGGCALVGHQDGWADDLAARANLELFARLHGQDTAAAGALMAELGIPNRAVRHLSAGQRRKLALARLKLIPRPLWLLDEPFDALDTQGCDWLAALAHTHLAGGGAIVLSSHQTLPARFVACRTLDLASRAATEAHS